MKNLVKQIKNREICALIVAIILVDVLLMSLAVTAGPQNHTPMMDIMRKFSELDTSSGSWWENTFVFAIIHALELYFGLFYINLQYPENR